MSVCADRPEGGGDWGSQPFSASAMRNCDRNATGRVCKYGYKERRGKPNVINQRNEVSATVHKKQGDAAWVPSPLINSLLFQLSCFVLFFVGFFNCGWALCLLNEKTRFHSPSPTAHTTSFPTTPSGSPLSSHTLEFSHSLSLILKPVFIKRKF